MDDPDLDLSLMRRAGGPVPATFPRCSGTGTHNTSSPQEAIPDAP